MTVRTIKRTHWMPRFLGRLVLAGLTLGALPIPGKVTAIDAVDRSPVTPCSAVQLSETARPHSSTTAATVEQVYTCLLVHYPTGPTLDDRTLLHGAMVGLITDLMRHDLDQSTAVLPALHGNHVKDWQAFRRAYLSIAARLPQDARTQTDLAQATISGLVMSLHDDHTLYAPPLPGNGGKAGGAAGRPAGMGEFGLGLRLSADQGVPARTTPPLFVVAVDAGSPAARAGLRAGDIITAIDGLPPFIQGVPDQTVLDRIDAPGKLKLRLYRTAGRRTMMVTLTAAPYPTPQPVTARVLPGNVAYVRLASFVDNSANFVVAALDGLRLGKHPHGLVLDLRGNGGGSAAEPAHLLSAFVHHRIFAYMENGQGHLTPQWTGTDMPLVRTHLVVLIDRGCASACDVTAAAIHDLHLGRLVGERTAGDAAGPAEPWFLDDGGVIQIPVAFMRGADGEIVDGIGVPPDDPAPVTAAALSAGRDPGIEQALQDLKSPS